MTDDELVEQIKQKKETAATELINRYYAAVLRYCRWHCSSLEQAEDMTQETFFKLFKSLPQYNGKKKFRAYLYTIANHVCIDESRKTTIYALEEENNLVKECRELNQIEDRQEINDLLKLLSQEQKEAVILRFGEQLSYSEISRVMGCNMRTAQSRIRNALKIMRKEKKDENKENAK